MTSGHSHSSAASLTSPRFEIFEKLEFCFFLPFLFLADLHARDRGTAPSDLTAESLLFALLGATPGHWNLGVKSRDKRSITSPQPSTVVP